MSAAPKSAPPVQKPPRWQGNEQALRAVQVAFDVEEAVMEAIRVAAFHGNVSTSTQLRQVLGLPVPARPKRQRFVLVKPAQAAIVSRAHGSLGGPAAAAACLP